MKNTTASVNDSPILVDTLSFLHSFRFDLIDDFFAVFNHRLVASDAFDCIRQYILLVLYRSSSQVELGQVKIVHVNLLFEVDSSAVLKSFFASEGNRHFYLNKLRGAQRDEQVLFIIEGDLMPDFLPENNDFAVLHSGENYHNLP
jgi:hypothetical protein